MIYVNSMKHLKPKPPVDQKKSMQLPSIVTYDFKSTVETVTDTVNTIYG